MKLHPNTIKKLSAIEGSASTPELAEVFRTHTVSVIARLTQYRDAGYLTSEPFVDVRENKNGIPVRRKVYLWAPTDKLRDLADSFESRRARPQHVANSVFEWHRQL